MLKKFTIIFINFNLFSYSIKATKIYFLFYIFLFFIDKFVFICFLSEKFIFYFFIIVENVCELENIGSQATAYHY